jgi:four helix bundle protein
VSYFHHERLDVYQATIEFIVVADEVASRLTSGRGYLADQLRRSATSIVLNIAEGAGEFSRKEKARFYRIARRSATECAAIFDVSQRLKLAETSDLEIGRQLLHRIVSMLTKMITSGTGTEAGTGTGAGYATAISSP